MEPINYKCKELRCSVKTLKTLPESRVGGEKYHPHLFPDSTAPQRASCGARSVTSDLICGLKRGFPCREFKLSKIMISGIIMGFVRLFSPRSPSFHSSPLTMKTPLWCLVHVGETDSRQVQTPPTRSALFRIPPKTQTVH